MEYRGRRILKAAAVAAVLLAAGVAGPAGADLVTTTPNVEVILPPASVAVHALESDTNVRVFQEKVAHTLGAPLFLDVDTPGSAISVGNLAAGTVVDSWYVHTDPVQNGPASYIATLTFDRDIYGLIVRDGSLVLSDPELAPVGTANAGATAARGVEFGGSDFFNLSADRRTVTIRWTTTTVVDDMRIVTAPTPEPASMVLAGMGLASLAGLRRRRGA